MVTAMVAILQAARISTRAAGEAHEPLKPMHVPPAREIPLGRPLGGDERKRAGFRTRAFLRGSGSGSSRVRSRPAVDGRGEG